MMTTLEMCCVHGDKRNALGVNKGLFCAQECFGTSHVIVRMYMDGPHAGQEGCLLSDLNVPSSTSLAG